MGENTGGDDQEPDIILDDLLKTSEEEISSKVLKNESTGIDSIENESEEGVSQGDAPRAENTVSKEEEEKALTVEDSNPGAEKNVSKEEEDDITPLKGIKTILIVTTNPDQNGRPDVELPKKSPEEKVNSEEFLVEEDKDLL